MTRPRPRDFDAVVFDCDGVLVDSEPIYARVVADLMTEAGYPRTALDCRHRYTGLNLAALLARIEEEEGADLTDALVGRIGPRAHEQMRGSLRACDGIHELISHLDGPKAVASNSSLESIRLSLEVVGLLEHFDRVVTSADEVHTGKPHPAVYELAASRAGADPHRCMAIEDSATGARAALAAGMAVVGFIGSSHDPEGSESSLRNAGVRWVVDDLATLVHA